MSLFGRNRATSGVQQVSSDLDNVKDAAVAAAITMAMTGSKMAAAWSATSTVLQNKILGPLSGISGFTLGWLRSLKSVTDEWGRLGARAAGAFEMLNNQFRPLLGSLEAAKNRMAELRKFAQETPFGMKDVAEANKILQNFSKGALATKSAMTLVGDAAAVAGSDLQSVAMWVGRLYDGLQSGRPVGEAAYRLQEMGIVTGQARNAIEKMQESGSSFAQMWGVVEQELGRARGAMEFTSKTLQGLQQQVEDAQEGMSAGFGEGYLDGQKASIEAQLKTIQMLSPAMAEWGKISGAVGNSMANLKLKVVETTASIPGMSSAIAVAGNSWAAFNAVLAGSSLAYGAAKIAAFFKNGAKLSATTASSVGMLKSAFGGITGAADQFLSGNTKAAQALAATALATGKTALQVGGLRGALAGAALGLRVATVQILAMSKAIFLNPIVLLAAGIATLIGITVHLMVAQQNHIAAMRAYASETDNLAKSMENTRNNLQTLQDLTNAHSTAVMKLADAYSDLGEAQRNGNKWGARNAESRVNAITDELERLRGVNPSSLRLSDDEASRRQQNSAALLGLAEQRSLAVNGMLPGGEQQAATRKFYEQQIEDVRAAEKSLQQIEAIRQRGVSASMEGSPGRQAAAFDLQSKIAGQQQLVDQAKIDASIQPSQTTITALRDAESSLASMRAELEGMSNANISGLTVAKDSGNEIAILEAQISLYREFQSVAEGAKKSGSAADQAKAAFLRNAVIGQFGGLPDARTIQDKEMAVKTMRSDLLARSDPGRQSSAQTELDRLAREQGASIASAALDLREKEISLWDNQVKAQEESVNLEKTRIDFAVQYQGLLPDIAAMQKAALDAELAKLKKVASERKAILELQMAAETIGVEASGQRGAGNNGAARALEAQQAAIEASRIYAETKKSVLSETGNAGLAEQQARQAAQNRMTQLAQQQSGEMRGEGFNRSKATAEQGAANLENQAAKAQSEGMTQRAAALKESATRLREEASVEEGVLKKMQEQGITREQATKAVKAEVETSRAGRSQAEQERQKREQLSKNGVVTDLEARRDELAGRDTSASRKRREQQSAEDQQGYIDQGFSKKEAKDMADRTERQSRLADAEERNIEMANNMASAFEALSSWIFEQTKLNRDRAYYEAETRALQQEAGGDQAGADQTRAQVQFEKDVQDVMDNLKLSQKEAENLVRSRGQASFDKDKNAEINDLIGQLKEVGGTQDADPTKAFRDNNLINQAIAGGYLKLGSEGITNRLSSTTFANSLSRIGGARALGGSDVVTRDLSALRNKTEQIAALMQKLVDKSNENYLASTTGADYAPKVYIPGSSGTGGYIN